MRVLRRFLRWPFTFGALAFFRIALRYASASPKPGIHNSPVMQVVFPALYFSLAALFAAAWWTTRKPSNKPNWFAVAASSIYLISGLFILIVFLRYAANPMAMATPLAIVFALGIGGIIVYSRGMSLGAVPAATPKPVRIQGDRTHPAIGKVVTGISYVAQFASVNLWGAYAHRHHFRYSVGLLYYAFIVAAGLITATIHEAAHTLVARAFKMKLLSFETGPFRWSQSQGKWSFKFTPANFLSLGGAVGIVPSNKLQPNSHEIAVLAAGPISNLILGGITWLAAVHAASAGHIFLWKLLAITASTSLIAAIVNILPFQIETGGYSDGARILQLASASPVADLHKALLAIKSTLGTPTRPRDHDVELLNRAADLATDPIQTLVLRLAISGHYEDRGMVAEARSAFKAAELFCRHSGLASTAAFPVGLHTAFVIGNASLKRDARSTRMWWKLFESKNPTKFNVDYFLARASYLLMENRIDEARIALQKADAEAATLPDTGSYNFDRDRCARLRNELDASAAQIAAQPARQISPLREEAPSGISFRPSFLASAVSTPETETAVEALLRPFSPVTNAHVAPAAPATPVAPAAEATPDEPNHYPNERRRWPRTQTAPGRNMWPRPMEG